MTVRALIELLQQQPPDAELVYYAQDDGRDSFSLIQFEADLMQATKTTTKSGEDLPGAVLVTGI